METSTSKHAVIKQSYEDPIEVWITRHDALALYKALAYAEGFSDSTRKRLRQDFKKKLEPIYHYNVKCCDCGKVLECTSDQKFTQKEIDIQQKHGHGLMCADCLEDAK